MTRDRVDLVDGPRSEVGEGPSWDGKTASLIWVDIMGRMVHRYWPESRLHRSAPVPTPVGAVCPSHDGLVLVLEDGFWSATDEVEELRQIAAVPHDRSIRMNDAKVDPRGRLWAGSMAYDLRPGAGALYRLDRGKATRVLVDVGISNGLDWSPDGQTFYYIDSLTQGIDAFEFDVDRGTLGARRRIFEFARDDGMPDGMCVDAEGYLWVGLWNGWGFWRLSPHGVVDQKVRIPVAQVTSCAFGGPNLDELYITTAALRLSDAERRQQPLAGSVFVYRPGVSGLPATPYAPGSAVGRLTT